MAFSQAAREAAAITRQQNKEARAAEKLMSTGVGPSKVFCDPAAPDPNAELRQCHIEGRLIADHYTEDQIAILQWAWTDEGIAARNAGKSDARVQVLSDPLANSLQKRKDDVKERGMESWEAENAMQQQIDRYGKPGFRTRYLSDATVKTKGLRRWDPVIVDGEPVKLGTLTMAQMPEDLASARNKKFRDDQSKRLDDVKRQYLESGQGTAVSD